jgi:hypothetical protein
MMSRPLTDSEWSDLNVFDEDGTPIEESTR